MQDKSRKISLHGYFNCERRFINSTTIHNTAFNFFEWTSITWMTKDLLFTNIQFKAQYWTFLLNYVNDFSYPLWIPYDDPVIKISSMKKKLVVVPILWIKGCNTIEKISSSNGTTCCTLVDIHKVQPPYLTIKKLCS